MPYTEIDARVMEFELPTTLIVSVGVNADGGFGISPGHLTDEQAGKYWDNMRLNWLEHCANLRRERAGEALGEPMLGRARSA